MAVSMNSIVDVSVEISSSSTPSTQYNLGLIIGNTKASSVTADGPRVTVFDSADDMITTGGYSASDPEVKAATAYFAQNPAPPAVAIGIAAASETLDVTVQKCRSENKDWYGVTYAMDAEDDAIIDTAKYVETATIPTVFFCSQNTAFAEDASTSLVAKLNALNLRKTLVFYYCLTETNDICHAVLGRVCGLNTLTNNSAYTLAYKNLSGVAAWKAISAKEQSYCAQYNANMYDVAGDTYNIILPGIMCDGTHFDEVFALDATRQMIQLGLMSILSSTRVIPQTDSGLSQLVAAVSSVCDTIANVGFIGSGIWRGSDVLGLKSGDAVPNGYYVEADSFANQSQTDREARKAPPIYVALKMAGAIEFVVVRVIVNR